MYQYITDYLPSPSSIGAIFALPLVLIAAGRGLGLCARISALCSEE